MTTDHNKNGQHLNINKIKMGTAWRADVIGMHFLGRNKGIPEAAVQPLLEDCTLPSSAFKHPKGSIP